jgi:hypothetical protein
MMTGMNFNDRSYSFVARIRNPASVCANAKKSNSAVPSARVKLTRSYYTIGLAILRMRLVSSRSSGSYSEL